MQKTKEQIGNYLRRKFNNTRKLQIEEYLMLFDNAWTYDITEREIDRDFYDIMKGVHYERA